MALLPPEDHPLAARSTVPLDALRRTQVDAGVGNDEAPEWVDLSVEELARREHWHGSPTPAWSCEADAAALGLRARSGSVSGP
jgi:hypothetical protein